MKLYKSNSNNNLPTNLGKKGHHKIYSIQGFKLLLIKAMCISPLWPSSPLKYNHILSFTRMTGMQILTLVRVNKSQNM